MDGITELSQERSKDSPKDLKVDGGNITCSINLKEDKEVVFSIPYSNGWTLYVDGKKQETNKANQNVSGCKDQQRTASDRIKIFLPWHESRMYSLCVGIAGCSDTIFFTIYPPTLPFCLEVRFPL